MLHLNLIPPQLVMPKPFNILNSSILSFLAACSREVLTVNMDSLVIFPLGCVRAGRLSDEKGFKDSITSYLTRCKDLDYEHLFQSI